MGVATRCRLDNFTCPWSHKSWKKDQNPKDKWPEEKAILSLSYSPIWHSRTKQGTRWHGNDVEGGDGPTRCWLQRRLRERPSCWKHLLFILKRSSPAGSLWTALCSQIVPHADHQAAVKLVNLSVSRRCHQQQTFLNPTPEKKRPETLFSWLGRCSCSHDSRILFRNLRINQDWRFNPSSPSSNALKTAGVVLCFYLTRHLQHLSGSLGFAGLFVTDVEMISSVMCDKLALPYQIYIL